MDLWDGPRRVGRLVSKSRTGVREESGGKSEEALTGGMGRNMDSTLQFRVETHIGKRITRSPRFIEIRESLEKIDIM